MGMESPDKRRKADDSYWARQRRYELYPPERARCRAHMARLPDSLSIALWITGAIWGLAIFAYLLGGSTKWILPLLTLGVLTGIAEWIMRHRAQ
jgi:hypothetical protein